MRRPTSCSAVLLGLLTATLPLPALASPTSPTSLVELDTDLRPQRDLLLRNLALGVDSEQSLRRYRALLDERRARRSAKLGIELQAATEKQQLQDRAQQIAEQRQGLDAVVGEHCQLSVDPQHPPSGAGAFMRGDWGRVVVKQQVELPAQNAFDQPLPLTLYKIAGQLRTYVFASNGPALWFQKPFAGAVGDLVLICSVSVHSEGSGSRLPPDFRDNILAQGFVAKLKEPPRIGQKGAWNPLHSVDEAHHIRLAKNQAKWLLPAEQPLVGRVMVKEDLGPVASGHRYLMATGSRDDFVLDVPSSLARKELLKPYRYAWIVMGNPQPDRERKTWQLTALDIEASYVSSAD